jgi:hypothetical protein
MDIPNDPQAVAAGAFVEAPVTVRPAPSAELGGAT